jgi:Ca2+-transporting ATPase
MQTEYWLLKKETLFEILESRDDGLNKDEIVPRLQRYGKNSITDKKKNSLLKLFFIQFLSPLIFILLFAGGVTLYLKEIVESVVIFLAVFINIFFSTYQEFKAENTIEKLNSFIKEKAKVLRNGETHEIDASEIVPGDILVVSYGSRIPADATLIEVNDLKIDESIITGESIPADKTTEISTSNALIDRHNYLFAGTFVTNGNGLAIVTSTGDNTEIGKIASSIAKTKKTQTPTQTAVKQISWYILVAALVIVTLVFFLGISRGESMFDMLILSSAVAVGAVPEALPIALTVILSIGVLNISKKGGLIRKLSAAETLGSTTLILTDKTGTLTKAQLSLENIYTLDELLDSKIDSRDSNLLSTKHKDLLKKAYLNIQSDVDKVTDNKANWIYSGSAFDIIILKSIYDLDIDIEDIIKNKLILPFNSTNKYSISQPLHAHNKEKIILGAPDVLIRNSKLNPKDQNLLLDHLKTLSEQGKRLIAIGKTNSHTKDIEGLELLGMFSFSDILRDNIHTYVKEIQNKGVKVKIISGDLSGTVRYIGEKVGIKVTDDEILTGDQIKNMSDDELIKTLPFVKIFARVTPEDKLRIGNLYRSLGEIVAMTGDGVNDAPALSAMDIGISLASATDVAKGAADMILIDNDFKTIVNTINEGHKIKSNIQKVFIYLMSTSLGAVFVVTGALVVGLSIPLNALQIIWINILTGTLPALAFAYNKEYSFTKNKINDKIFNFKVKFMTLGIGTVSSILLFVLYFVLQKYIADTDVAKSIFFLCYGTYALTVSYSFKNLDKLIFQYNPFSNMRLNVANIIGFGLIVSTTSFVFMREVFNLSFVGSDYVWIIVLWNVLNVALIELTKFMFMRFVRS